MKMQLQKILITGLFVMGIGMVQKAYAGTSDGMTVNVTPGNVAFGVTITSVNPSGYDFQTVNLGGTTVSTKAIGVQNSGTLSELFVMAVATTTSGGSDQWVPIGADNATPGVDAYELLGQFQTTGSAMPAYSTFVASMFIPGTALGAANGLYNESSAAKVNAGVSKDLWLALRMPSTESTSDATAHKMQLTITGVAN